MPPFFRITYSALLSHGLSKRRTTSKNPGLANFRYDEDYRISEISKTVPFDVFAAVFTPAMNALRKDNQEKLWFSTMTGLFFTVVTYLLNVRLN